MEMSDYKIVGLAGQLTAGKDTAAQALVSEGYKRVAFADKIKELAMEANPLVTTNVQTVNIGTGAGKMKHVVNGNGGWDQSKDYYPLVREFLVNLGEGARKVFGEDFWIDQALDDVRGEPVVSDVRYENEMLAIRDRGGIIIRIDRDNRRPLGDHETELMSDDRFDGIVVNDGTVGDLQRKVVEMVEGLQNPPKKLIDIEELIDDDVR